MEFDLHFIILLFLSYLHCGTEASQNIALEKSAEQSSTYGTNYIASRAVDGYVGQVYDSPNYCTHTMTGQNEAWWQVNLGSLSDINSVKIYYRKSTSQHDSTRRLDGFQVIVSLSDNWRNKTPCYNDTVGEPYPNDVVTVPCVDQGRYLTIYNKHNAQEDKDVGPILELCEVQVNGCERGRYGINCAQTCSSGCVQSSCDPDNGNCKFGCGRGRYGIYCAQTCSSGCVQSSCDPDNGNCKFGCEKGWKGNKCDTACGFQEYGYFCDSTCNCKTGGCNNVNGTCFSLGCLAGWTGHNCSVECSTTRFGEDCATTCHCYTEGCDKISGRCNDQKCKPGWTSESCSRKCPLSTFGDDCKKICNCATPGCDHVYGVCDHGDGCQAGWNGTRCDITCKQDTFGPNCIHQCHCLNGTCYRTNGTCAVVGCEAGWAGETCSKACENGTFGNECNNTCYCAVGSCNHISGKCVTPGCQEGWQGISCSERLVESKPNEPDVNNSIPIVVGIVIAVLLAAILCGIVVFAIRRKKQNKKQPGVPSQKFDNLGKRKKEIENKEARSYMNVSEVEGFKSKNSVKTSNDAADNVYMNTKEAINQTLIRVENLKTIISEYKPLEFETQYKKIPYGSLHPHTAGELEVNKQKNRFLTTFPYDHTRVVLNTLAEDPNSDYINASYVDSVNKKAQYVATQGPRKNTIDDFWRMIWQIKCGKIVMLTNLIENGKVKCAQYWPEFSKSLTFGDLNIKLETDRENLCFSIKEFNVTHTKTGEIRSINHFHFTAWPDHGTPDPIQLMLFHRRFMEIKSDQSGPPIIHCSAGIGRTGTFIALDALYKEGQKTGEIDVFRYVHTMRENRMNMIQTKEQYVVLHEALLEAFQFKDTSHTKEYFSKGIYENDKDIKEEFERLNRSKPVFDEKEAYKGAKEKVNQCKNRNNTILPVDRYRPYLISHSPARTNYINAVILPSYQEHVGFLATQYPLPDTVVDLWSMIYDHDSSTIVTLDNLPKNEKDVEWLPKDSEEMVCDSYTIQQTREPDICGETKETELVLRYEATERSIKLFQYQGWEITNDVPSSPNGILKLIEMVNSWKIAGEKGPITVICTDGAKCCGVFCLIYTIIQSMRYEDKVDIFQSVRLLQLRRPEFFSSLEQYRFCYNAVQEYLDSANIYYN